MASANTNAWPGVAEVLSALVKAPSISGSEEPAIKVLAEALASAGVNSQIIGRNLVATIGSGEPVLWLVSHLDTVQPAQGYSFDPWLGSIDKDGRLLGLGANDAKASVAAMAEVLVRLKDVLLPGQGQVMLVAACDEETGGEGVEMLRTSLPTPAAAIVGEPNDLVVANCCKGLVRAKISIEGIAAHASRPWQGDNAIRKISDVLNAICIRPEFPHDDILGFPTVEPTLISGGHQANAIAEKVEIILDCRTTPAFDNDKMVSWLHQRLEAFPYVSLTIHSERLKASRTSADGSLVQAALRVTSQPEPGAFPSVCDFVWLADVDAIVMGPGQPQRSHQADEFVLVEEVLKGVSLYERIVRRYFELPSVV